MTSTCKHWAWCTRSHPFTKCSIVAENLFNSNHRTQNTVLIHYMDSVMWHIISTYLQSSTVGHLLYVLSSPEGPHRHIQTIRWCLCRFQYALVGGVIGQSSWRSYLEVVITRIIFTHSILNLKSVGLASQSLHNSLIHHWNWVVALAGRKVITYNCNYFCFLVPNYTIPINYRFKHNYNHKWQQLQPITSSIILLANRCFI